MSFIKQIIFFFFLGTISLTAQDTPSPKIEFGVSLLSCTREFETRNIYRNRYEYVGLLNGYVFKYHRVKNGTFRLRFRIIGQQSLGAFTEAFDGIRLGDNFNDIGFEIAGGYQFFINKNAKRWKYYYGADFGFLKNKEKEDRDNFQLNLSGENKYYSISINPFLGIKLKASKFLAFSIETSWVAGRLEYSRATFQQNFGDFELYWNPVSIFAATITLPQKKKGF